ncbi:O-antigen ligase like membrane protein [Parafrankia irregularis]|uniref:O-antigen ligase like membrane protein n=1 Tax=Parafrankia irregularis TaxID=795642 RepID=A0A0S4QS04_9ACTN|nr:O-antigen ligase family protein [Parafrankia irregularis]MBE3205001.1 O-antigen ligase family protein [Parafrankia sp. CH37]CUU58523.1 O-antigen ligase like membrane protein [Parafrankia irregularis]
MISGTSRSATNPPATTSRASGPGAALAPAPSTPLAAPPASAAASVPSWLRSTSHLDTVSLLTLFLFLLLGLSAQLVIGSLGSAATPANLIGLAGLLCWLGGRLHPALGLDQAANPVRVAALMFMVVVLLSYTASNGRVTSAVEIRAADRGLIATLCWLGIMLIACDGVSSLDRMETLLRRLAIGGGLLGLLGLVQFYTGFNPLAAVKPPGLQPIAAFDELSTRSDFVRIKATASHPIEAGVVFAAILPFALHFALQPAATRLRGRLRWVGVVMLLVALPMTLSRGGLLAATVTFIVLFTGWPSRIRVRALIITPVFLVIMRLAVPGLLGTVRSMFAGISEDPSTSGRTSDYATVGHYFDQSPLFGRGFRTFLPNIYRTLDNQYLGSLVEIGAVGMVVLILLFGIPLACAVIALRRAPDQRTKDLIRALAASVFAVMLSYATFDALSFSLIASLTFLLLGCCGAAWRLTRQPAPRERNNAR